MSIRIIAWPIWIILLFSFVAYVPILQYVSEQPIDIPALENNYQIALEILLVIAALIEAMITIFLRHRFLVKALNLQTVSLDSIKGKIRFIVVHIANWLIASLIATTGLVFAIVTKHADWSYGFFIVYIGLMLFHSPRLAPYKIKS